MPYPDDYRSTGAPDSSPDYRPFDRRTRRQDDDGPEIEQDDEPMSPEEIAAVEDAPDFTRLLREKAERQQASARTVSNVMGAAIVVATDGRTISLKGTVS